jgi:hypothetical protein
VGAWVAAWGGGALARMAPPTPMPMAIEATKSPPTMAYDFHERPAGAGGAMEATC